MSCRPAITAKVDSGAALSRNVQADVIVPALPGIAATLQSDVCVFEQVPWPYVVCCCVSARVTGQSQNLERAPFTPQKVLQEARS